MKKISLLTVLSAILISACAAPVAEEPALVPSVSVSDQEVVDGAVTISGVSSNGQGWIVIHIEQDGAPGPIIGYSQVSDGLNADVVVEIDESQSTERLFAMLHTDAGELGTYEFPGDDAPVKVDDAVVVKPFMVTMEAVLADIVDTAVAAGSFETLVAAVQAAGLVDALKGEGPFTVFAPSDDAFAKLPAGTLDALLADPEGQLSRILLYHVIPGKVMAADVADGLTAETLRGAEVAFSVFDGKVMINDAEIVATDIETSNGVIHVIDSVILPPDDLVDVAIGAGSFNTLVAAVQAAGLEATLRGNGPFTIFAPTDDAFAKLPEGTVEALLADPEALANILLYHVLSGKVMAADVSDGLEAETAQGSIVSFAIHSDGTPAINGALITATDIEAFNGVIHVIDTVILPPAE